MSESRTSRLGEIERDLRSRPHIEQSQIFMAADKATPEINTGSPRSCCENELVGKNSSTCSHENGLLSSVVSELCNPEEIQVQVELARPAERE